METTEKTQPGRVQALLTLEGTATQEDMARFAGWDTFVDHEGGKIKAIRVNGQFKVTLDGGELRITDDGYLMVEDEQVVPVERELFERDYTIAP